MSNAIYFNNSPDDRRLEQLRRENNPNNEPTGHFTGRCAECGSKRLWDDNLNYGCEDCGAVYICN